MTATAVLREALRRVNGAPTILIGAWLSTVVLSVPATLVVRDAIARQLGASLQAEPVAAGADADWMEEFRSGASGAASTLGAPVVGFAAVLDNASGLLDAETRPTAIWGATALFLAGWLLLSAGIIDRLARDHPTRAYGFFAAVGGHAGRFLRLAIVMVVAYGILFGSLHPWLFNDLFPAVTANMTSERSAFLVMLALYALFVLALAACNLAFDYAKVRIVVEDRRSALGALAGALRFVRRNAGIVAALYAANAALLMIVFAVYAVIAPGAGTTGWTMWLGFVIGQGYVAARVWVKLVFWATETVLFQSRLAHAAYVASPAAEWPEGAGVEGFRVPGSGFRVL